MKENRNMTAGFTMLELLVAVAILMLVGALSFGGLYSMRARQALDASARSVAALVEEARNSSAASKNGLSYGVHFQADKAVMFEGSSYSSSAASNRTVPMGFGVTISSITVSGGGSDVVFDRLTGATDDAATTTLSVSGGSSGTTTRTIVIHSTGLVDLR